MQNASLAGDAEVIRSWEGVPVSKYERRLPVILWSAGKVILFDSAGDDLQLDVQGDFPSEKVMTDDEATKYVAGRWRDFEHISGIFACDTIGPSAATCTART